MTVEEFCGKYGIKCGKTKDSQISQYTHYYLHIQNGFEEENIFNGKEIGFIISQFEKVAFGIDEDEVIIDLANYKK